MGQSESSVQFRFRIDQLLENQIAVNDHIFWREFFTSNIANEDVFSLIQPEDIRQIRKKQPGNLGLIVFKSVEQLYLFSTLQKKTYEYTSALNSLRLLTRILPFIYEHDDDKFGENLFMKNSLPYIKYLKKEVKDKPKEGEKEKIEQKQNPQKTEEKKLEEEKSEEKEQVTKVEVEKEEVKVEEKKSEEEKSEVVKEEKEEEVTKVEEEKTGEEAPKKEEEKVEEQTEEKEVKKPIEEEKEIEITPKLQEEEKEKPKVEEITLVKEEEEVKTESKPKVEPEQKKLQNIITHIGNIQLDVPFARVLVETLMKLCFKVLFTVPESQIIASTSSEESKDDGIYVYDKNVEKDLIWEGGAVVSTENRNGSDQFLNRIEVLKCLLATLSQTLYCKGSEVRSFRNVFIEFATNPKSPHVGTLFYSLLNVIFSYNPTGSFAYSTTLISSTGEDLVDVCADVFCLLVHYRHEKFPNSFTDCLRKMSVVSDINFCYQGIVVLLNNIIDANNTYFPGSQKMIECYEEILIILFKFLDENKKFKVYVSKDGDVTKLLIPLLFFIQKSQHDAAKFPLVQISCFILLSLSGVREFGVALNRPFDIKVPLEYPLFSGSYGELLFIVVQKAMVSDKGIIRPLFECLLTTLCNVSPYLKTMSMVGSSKVIALFEAFASKKFLYSSERNHQYVYLLIELFNNVIQYQYEGNVQMIYSILRKKEIFSELNSNIDLEAIVANLKKKKDVQFIPTEEWLSTWKPKLPLKTVLTLLKILVPEVEDLCVKSGSNTEEDILLYLKKTTLVGLLPVPHTIVIRTFASNPMIDAFVTTYLWGLIYLRNQYPPLFDAKAIKLFRVNILE